jgi:hypothetical protein
MTDTGATSSLRIIAWAGRWTAIGMIEGIMFRLAIWGILILCLGVGAFPQWRKLCL